MIRVEDEGRLRTIRLNRPDKANALTHDMLAAVAEAAETAAVIGMQALILTGEGRVFSAGADLDAAKAGLATDPVWTRAAVALAGFPGLSVAALNGTLAGGAFALALPCDIRLAVPGAGFFYPVMRLGYRPQPADPERMTRLIGPGRAKMILMAGQKIGAEEALAWGLVDRIVASEALMEEARRLCADALAASAGHVAAIKAMIG